MIEDENQSRIELAQKAYDMGAISYEELEKILNEAGINTKSEEKENKSRRELIEIAKKKNAISDDEYYKLLEDLEKQPQISVNPEEQKYERGKSSLDLTPEQIEKYNVRREKSTKNVPWLPNFLYPTGEEMAREGQQAAKGVRNLATLPGALLDLPLMPANLTMGLAGKRAYVPSQLIGEAIDTASKGYTRPESDQEKIEESVLQSVAPMGTLKAIGSKAATYGSKLINKPGQFLASTNATNPTNILGTAAGAAGTQQYLNMNPEGGLLETLPIGYISSILGGKTGKNLDLLTTPKTAVSRMFHVNPNKVSNQMIDPKTGKYITSTLADISDSDNIKFAQHALSKTPFLGNFVKNARGRALEAEQSNLNKMGFTNALGNEDLGDLALLGANKHKENVGNQVSQIERQIKHGLQSHAKPYPFPQTNPQYLEQLERRKYNEQLQRKMRRQDLDKDTVDFQNDKNKSKRAKEREIIENYTEKSSQQLRNEPINLAPYPNTKKLIAKTFKNSDIPEAQHIEFNNKFGKITEELDDFAKIYKREGVPIKTLDTVRKNIDDAITTWGEVGNVTQGKLKQMRNSIQKDIGNYLESKDPNLKKIWDEKNKLYHQYKKIDEPHITAINKINDTGVTENITKSLLSNLKNAGQKVKTFSKGLNEKQKETFGFSLMSELGKETVDSDFDLFTFGKNYKKVKGGGKKAFNDLFTPDQAKNVDRLGKRMKNINDASSLANNSPTGYINKFYQTIRHPIKSIGGTAGSAVILGMYTNPKFLNWISQGSHINSDLKMHQHVQKLNKMNLGTNTLNQSVRKLYNSLDESNSEE